MFDAHLTLASLGSAAAIALGALLAALLAASARGNRAANRWLATLVAALALLAVGDLLMETRYLVQVPQLAFSTDWLILALGPCMWLYVRRMTGDSRPRGWRLGLHFVPMLCLLLALVPYGEDVHWASVAAALHVLVYWLGALFEIARYRARAADEIASLDRIGLGWLKILLRVTLAIWVSWLLGLVLDIPGARSFNGVAVPAGLYVLAFFALRQPAVLVRWSKHAGSSVDQERALEYHGRLAQIMATERPWLKNELTLADLATAVGCTPPQLSRVLNDLVNMPFFDYVNWQRVQEVRRRLEGAAYDAEPVRDIALASGFNSEAELGAVFRKMTGRTPSECRRAARAARTPVPAPEPS
jgi:AraC-like DNA-binding protein